MATDTKHVEALDQLQKEVNATLENIGRLFSAAQHGTKGSAAARALRLKRDMPGSIGRYHAALDVLDGELQLAKAVMRRDLAVWREQSGIQPAKPDTDSSQSRAESMSDVPGRDHDQKPVSAADNVPSEQSLDEETTATKISSSPKAPEVSSAPVPPAIKSPENENTSKPSTKAQDLPTTTSRGEFPALQAASSEDKKPTPAELTVDTTASLAKQDLNPETSVPDQHPADSDPSADHPTATETADLESLFNDPGTGTGSANLSAPGSGPATIASEAQDQDFTSTFDFGSFNASLSKPREDGQDLHPDEGEENDTLSAFLPGVQEYANMASTANGLNDNDDGGMGGLDIDMGGMDQPNFDELFAADGPGDLMGGGEGSGMAGGGVGDTSFEDLMDFGGFGDGGGEIEFGDGGGEGSNNNNTNNQDFDFGL